MVTGFVLSLLQYLVARWSCFNLNSGGDGRRDIFKSNDWANVLERGDLYAPRAQERSAFFARFHWSSISAERFATRDGFQPVTIIYLTIRVSEIVRE